MITKVDPGPLLVTHYKTLVADDLEMKAGGRWAARFLSWGGPDLDGDHQQRGSISNLGADVAVSSWAHSSWGTSPPIGRATLTDDSKGPLPAADSSTRKRARSTPKSCVPPARARNGRTASA